MGIQRSTRVGNSDPLTGIDLDWEDLFADEKTTPNEMIATLNAQDELEQMRKKNAFRKPHDACVRCGKPMIPPLIESETYCGTCECELEKKIKGEK